MFDSAAERRALVAAVAVMVVLATVPAAVSARTSIRPTVKVPAGQTLEEDLTAVAGTVLVLGTVEGDVTALAGDVVVNGEVTGDVTAFGGRVEVTGRVGGSVTTVTGSTVARGDLDGDLETIGGTLEVAGDVAGTVEALGVFVTVERDATVHGELQTTAIRTRVNGTVRGGSGPVESRTLGSAPLDARRPGGGVLAPRSVLSLPVAVALQPFQIFPRRWSRVSFLDLYGFVASLLLGVVLVGFFPRFSRRVAETVAREPLRTGATGIGVSLVVPLALLAVGLSLFGLPLALAGGALYWILLWAGAVYGRFAVGMWLLAVVPAALAYVDVEARPVENRWVSLLVGAVVVGLLLPVPYLGRVVDAVVLALGFGAVARLAYGTYLRTERPDRVEATATSQAAVADPDDRTDAADTSDRADEVGSSDRADEVESTERADDAEATDRTDAREEER